MISDQSTESATSSLLLSNLSLLVRDHIDESRQEFILEVVCSHEVLRGHCRVAVQVSVQGHSLSADVHIHLEGLVLWAHSSWKLARWGNLFGDSRWGGSVGLDGLHVAARCIALFVWLERVLVAVSDEVDVVFGKIVFVLFGFTN